MEEPSNGLEKKIIFYFHTSLENTIAAGYAAKNGNLGPNQQQKLVCSTDLHLNNSTKDLKPVYVSLLPIF
jgi:hypothetical protein